MIRCLRVLVVVAFATVFLLPTAAQSPKVLQAGAASSNITPPLGSPIVGGWQPIPATHVHDELWAKCLVLDDGQTRVGIVVADIILLPRRVCDAAKKMIQQETGIAVDRLLISTTHTHSAAKPWGTSEYTLNENLDHYQLFVARRIADGVRLAVNNLQPARAAWSVGYAAEHVFNRRWFLKEGTPMPNPFGGYDKVQTNPGTDALDRPAGPTDPQVSFLAVQTREGRPIAVMANYSLHYVGGVRESDISADYYGYFAKRLEELIAVKDQDPPFVAIMSNGTSGDINNIHFDYKGPTRRYQPYEKMRIVGNSLAAEVYKQYQTLTYHEWVPVDMRQSEIQVGFRVPTGEQLAYARKIEAKPETEKPHHRFEKIYAGRVLEMAKYPASIPLILQTLQIGDLGIAAIPNEPFAEIGLELKRRSPFKQTFVVSMANGHYGYLPTVEQHQLGGYETWLSSSRLEFEASRKIVDSLLKMFGELSAKHAE